ncbi:MULTISPECIES: hypothetical protein [Kribbella]|uniref:hypothetical protein n=1 Tax=Kribbella TaxID=182639 RepID=UPI0031E42D56
MAIRIELWVDGRLIDGVEQWWDDLAAALPVDEDFPMLGRVDAYGDVVFARDELEVLAAEARRFVPRAPDRVRPLLLKLAELCTQGGSEGELRFLGD